MIKIIQVFLWFLVIGAGAYAQEQASGGDRVGAASIGDRWGVELYSPDAGSSVVVPLYGFVSPAVKDAFAHIADEEAFPM